MAEKTERQKLIDSLEAELHKVEAITQKLPLTSYPLYINGKAFPKIWIPSWHNMEVEEGEHDYDHCDKQIEGSVGGGTVWACTMPEDHFGFSHVASYIEKSLEGKDDQVLEIWGNRERSLDLSAWNLWVYDSTYGDPVCINRVHLPSFSRVYENHYGGSTCHQREVFTGNRWVCTMPTAHRYSHIATSGAGVLAVWEKTD